MSALLRKPGPRVLRGLNMILSEMAMFADVKADEGAEGRSGAADVRAALAYIRAAITKATGSAA